MRKNVFLWPRVMLGLMKSEKREKREKREFPNRWFSSSQLRNKEIRDLSGMYKELSIFINTLSATNSDQLKLERFVQNFRLDSCHYVPYSFVSRVLRLDLKENDYLNRNIKNVVSGFSTTLKLRNLSKVEETKIRSLFQHIEAYGIEEIETIILGSYAYVLDCQRIHEPGVSTVLHVGLGIRILKLGFYLEYKELKKGFFISSSFKFADWMQEYDRMNFIYNSKIAMVVGSTFFNVLLDLDLVQLQLRPLDWPKRMYIYVPGPCSHYEAVKDKSEDVICLPTKLPMLVPPKEYSPTFKWGGWHTNESYLCESLIIPNSSLKESSVLLKDSKLYKVVNLLGSVGFQLNKQVFNFLLVKGEELGILHPDVEHKKELLQHKKLNLQQQRLLESYESKEYFIRRILDLAYIYYSIPSFYMGVRLDQRGRIYPNIDFFHYQGNDLAKSLLLFSKRTKIFKNDVSAIGWLKVYGANCFGIKDTHSKKVEWVEKHEEMILKMEKDISFIKKAVNKPLFIAFCFEYMQYKMALLNDKTFFYSYFPIQLDATCNGYQHLALLTGDAEFAKLVNLSDSFKTDLPRDFYDVMSKLVEVKLRSIDLNTVCLEEQIRLKRLLRLPMNRTLLKSSLMVKVYSASFLTLTDYLKDNFLEHGVDPESRERIYRYKVDSSIFIHGPDFFVLTKYLKECLDMKVPSIAKIIFYLRGVASVCTKLGISIPWVLPSGLKVAQSYLKEHSIQISPFYFRNNKFSLNIRGDQLDMIKQQNAIMPNLVHSLDGASLAEVVVSFSNALGDDFNMFAIHDCFGFSYNHVDSFILALKNAYILLYCDEQYLIKFDAFVKDAIRAEFGQDLFVNNNKIFVKNLNLEFPNVLDAMVGDIPSVQIKKAHYVIG